MICSLTNDVNAFCTFKSSTATEEASSAGADT